MHNAEMYAVDLQMEISASGACTPTARDDPVATTCTHVQAIQKLVTVEDVEKLMEDTAEAQAYQVRSCRQALLRTRRM
eukprot:365028-Chlamydomonas_euryale.AAC.49